MNNLEMSKDTECAIKTAVEQLNGQLFHWPKHDPYIIACPYSYAYGDKAIIKAEAKADAELKKKNDQIQQENDQKTLAAIKANPLGYLNETFAQLQTDRKSTRLN